MFRAHLAYARYVTRHKWFVLMGGMKTHAPLWQLIVHDWSKFTRTEWGPYVRQFYNQDGSKRSVRRPDGGYDPNAQTADFQRAWLSHQKRKHHWQAWVSIGEGGDLSPQRIARRFVREMVADWLGAGRAITGRWDIVDWYAKNRDLMILHDETRVEVDALVERVIRVMPA